MDADRSGDQVTEPAVDRELQALLAVEPSPEFVARVRARIAEEPQPSAWWQSWRFATAVAVAAVVVLAIVMTRPREAVRPQPDERREASAGVARPTLPPAVTAQERHAQPSVASQPYVASAFRRTRAATSPAVANISALAAALAGGHLPQGAQ